MTMLVFGHRGAKGYALENTIESFEKAVSLGIAWVELDVQLVSNQLYVFHDFWLDRLAGIHTRLCDLTTQQIEAVRLANGEGIPLLAAIFDRFKGKLRINVELKGSTGAPELAAFIKEQLTRGWSTDDLLISSFDLKSLKEFHHRCPEVWTGALYYGLPVEFAGDVSACGARSVHLSLEYASKQIVSEVHACGCKAFVYTVNETQEIALMKQCGVDGIFSDYPDRAV